jgi:hypothetical protein
MAGQDITANVSEPDLDIHDTLGQGAGVGGGSSGRATQATLKVSKLGPAASAIGAGGAIPQEYQALLLADGVTTLYKMQEAVGTTLVDSGPAGINATLSGTYALQQRNIAVGVPNSKSIFFDGITGTAKTAAPLSHSTTHFSFECGFTMPDSTNNGFNGLVDTGNPGGSNVGFDIGFRNDDAGFFFFDLGNGATNTSASTGVAGVAPGTLMHVVGTYDGSTMRLYLNGVEIANAVLASFMLGTDPFTLASRHAGGFGNARIDMAYAAFYDGKTLSGGQVANHYSVWSTVYQPKLVRMGEVIIKDATGVNIFGGYATGLDDKTDKKTVYVQVDCTDYWQHLTSVVVNEVYDGQNDIFIINDLLNKYAPWIDRSLLGTTPHYTFGPENYQHFTLQKALQRVADKVGFSIWIDPYKKIHYINPIQASTAPFGLSDTPDFSTSFQLNVSEFTIDDTAIINRVYFYGGKHLSGDIVQDLSVQCNGVNTLFTLAYYPHKAADGKFHLIVNSVDHHTGAGGDIGFVGGITNADKLVHDGGTAYALLNIDAHTIEWNVAPAGGASVQFKYRHEVPLVVVLIDQNSVAYFGMYMDGPISDQSVFDTPTAIKRCQTLLLEQSFGLTHLKVHCWKPGIQAGQIIRIDHVVKAIHSSYIVQEVHVIPKGAGFFEYELTLGAWNWELVDIIYQLAKNATPDDTSFSEEQTPITVQTFTQAIAVHDAWAMATRTMGGYLYRDTPVGDGHDGYFGLASFL